MLLNLYPLNQAFAMGACLDGKDGDQAKQPDNQVSDQQQAEIGGNCFLKGVHVDGHTDAAADVAEFVALAGMALETGLIRSQRSS